MASLIDLMDGGNTEYNNKIAVIYENQHRKRLMNYREVYSISEAVSTYLLQHDMDRQLIGILNDDPLFHPALILGVLQSNASFWSIEPNGPTKLLRDMILKLNIRMILCANAEEGHLIDLFKEFKPVLENIPDTTLKAIHLQAITRVKNISSFAFVITTSGTTGSPKSVRVPHTCIVPNIIYFKHKFKMTSDDVVFQASPWTFDPSLVNLFTALSVGASLLIVEDSMKLLPHMLSKVLLDNKASIIQATPSLISNFPISLLRDKLLSATGNVRVLALGGEACPRTSVLRTWRGENCRARFFNLYGITEVSCWATCHEVTDAELAGDFPVPLGECLPDTTLVIRNEEGRERDKGVLFIGGENRVCMIDDETKPHPGTLRCTGDQVVRHSNGHIYYEGRTDEQYKRNGKRLNLLQLQEVALQQLYVTSAVAIMNTKQWLILFVILDTPTNPSTPAADSVDGAVEAEVDVIGQIQHLIRCSLPSQYVPDEVVVIEKFPMTSHGKVDKKALMQIIKHCTSRERNSHANTLLDVLQDVLQTNPDISVTFTEQGGNSFMLLSFINKIELKYNITLDGAVFEKLMLEPLSVGLEMIEQMITGNKEISSSKRNIVNIENDFSSEKILNTEESTSKKRKLLSLKSEPIKGVSWYAVQRCGVSYVHDPFDASKGLQTQRPDSEISQDNVATQTTKTKTHVSLSLKFKHDFGKCIDASPLFCSIRILLPTGLVSSRDVFRKKNEDVRLDLVILGSHSHRFAAVNTSTGQALWDIKLPDRIESSACLSACGCYVVVGCYDCKVYVVEIQTGTVFWAFATGGEVKCSPCLDPVTGWIIVGSHDKMLYALDIEKQECKWRNHLGGGSIYSSPAICTEPHLVVAATLTGIVAAINPLNGNILWKQQLPKPVFSSPAIRTGRIYVGCVNNKMYCFDMGGDQLWTLTSHAPIFSSSCVTPSIQNRIATTIHDVTQTQLSAFDQAKNISEPKLKHVQKPQVRSNTSLPVDDEFIVFGSHDHHVYCVSKAGKLVWKFKTESPVFSSPFIVQLEKPVENCDVSGEKADSTYADQKSLYRKVVIACCTSGVLYVLSLNNGALITSYRFPHEIFSSPIVHENTIYVCCRDDFLYSIAINQ